MGLLRVTPAVMILLYSLLHSAVPKALKVSSVSLPDVNVHVENAKPVYSEAIIPFDNHGELGRTFEGIGAISGGGATSKLLVNYPETERGQILDYLFKPNFGASLQIFKVEIGGDAQSTDGTEASHMHNKWEENYSRGYEWWLMKEAKKRNPDIKLFCLPWGFPGWIGEGTHSPYKNVEQTADYVVKWIQGAKSVHNLTIDYVGIWNERPYTVAYIKTLRRLLDNRGFKNTLIIAPDEFGWRLVKDFEKDHNLASSVHAVGTHYPGTFSSEDAKKSKKPLWSSEDYSTFNDEVGGGCWARILNQNYVKGLMTSTISWNLIGSYYSKLPYERDGLMTAMEPWSGHYDVSTPIWVTAHTTQFVPVGWTYLSHDSGVGMLPKGGSYVSFTNDAQDQLTIVIETMTHDHSKCIRPKLKPYDVKGQTITLMLKGSFKNIKQMNVWHSKLMFNGSESQMFMRKEPLTFVGSRAKLTLGVDEIYTLTTLQTGKKGSHPKPPDSAPFPQVVNDDFSAYAEYQEPNYLAPQIGSYEVRKVDGQNVVRQTVLQIPVYWCEAETAKKTISIIGDHSWSEMRLTTEFKLPAVNATDGVFVAARVDRGGCQSHQTTGIFFFVFPTTGKFIVSNDLARKKVLTTGSFESSKETHHLSLDVHKSTAVGHLDDEQLFKINIPTSPKNGFAAIGTDSFGLADFFSYKLEGPKSRGSVQRSIFRN